jgi:hypothetical protein
LLNKIDTFAQFPTKTIAKSLEHFNEYLWADILEGKIDSLMRRLEKMQMEKGAQDLKAAKAWSTCEECEEYNHVQGDCPRKHWCSTTWNEICQTWRTETANQRGGGGVNGSR